LCLCAALHLPAIAQAAESFSGSLADLSLEELSNIVITTVSKRLAALGRRRFRLRHHRRRHPTLGSEESWCRR
jgi:hypothetical protein